MTKRDASSVERDFVLTAMVGDNADLFKEILQLYFADGSIIADVTFGSGAFWKKIPKDKYKCLPSDLKTGVDLRDTPHSNNYLDGFILDPPYAHSSTTKHRDDIAGFYNLNSIAGCEAISKLYKDGVSEAYRTLKVGGILIVKCQDEVVGGKQRWNHISIMSMAESNGFLCEDLFVLVRKNKPLMRHKHQVHARKNHSYFLVLRKSPSKGGELDKQDKVTSRKESERCPAQQSES